jgi:uncharacterized membrane protein YdjX (TVP38/TMEM64 family)
MFAKLRRPLVLVCFLVLLAVLGLRFRTYLDLSGIEALIATMGVWAPLGFIGLYAASTLLFIPGSVLTLAGGFLFGPVVGTFYNLCGAMLGATFAFLSARYLAGDWVTALSGTRLQRLNRAVAASEWRCMALVRLVPLFPFCLLNYALGLTAMRLSIYVFASMIFMLPGTAAYTYVGWLGRSAIAGELMTLLREGFLVLAVIVLLALLPQWLKQLKL